MGARDLVQRVAASYAQGHTKVATFPPFSKQGPPPPPPNGGPSEKRNIPDDHAFDPRALKPMAKALWATSVSLGHALSAYRHLNRLKSTTVSPDGMLGGRGYIMPVKDARQRLFDACEALSALTDTLYDEIQAPHWKPKLAQLDEHDAEDVERFVEESQKVLESPEDDADEEMDEIEHSKDKKKSGEDKPKASGLPGSSPSEESEAQPPQGQMAVKQASVQVWNPLAEEAFDWPKYGNSSISPAELPGPRVDHLDRGEQLGPWGSYNTEEEPSNNWFENGQREYDYPHEGDNDLREAGATLMGESAVPDSTTDDTPTEAWDFGIGYGAHGQGAGGYENPSGEGAGNKGVWGPHSGLPGSPATSVNDTTPLVDVSLNERHALLTTLPGDTDEPVARSDYYTGPKGNLVQSESAVPREDAKPIAESKLPQETTPFVENHPPAMDTGYVTEDAETPYVRYDYTTHTLRNDPLHNLPQEKLPEFTWPQQG